MPQRRIPDVLVVGGGPIGLAAAIAARLQGLETVLLESRQPPIDKACGEGIMPGGSQLLGGIGVQLPAGLGVPIAGIEFIEGAIRARARFAEGSGLGVRRTVLHAALARRAADLGVDLRWGLRALRLEVDGVETAVGRIIARWVVGADGMNSPVRRSIGLDVDPTSRRFGIRRHYAIDPWTSFVEVHWSQHGEAYVTPVDRKTVSVAILTRSTLAVGGDPATRFDMTLKHFPGLERSLRGSQPVGEPLASGTVSRRLPRVVRERTALVGDASGSVDAISGEGLTLGLRQAVLLARCLRAGDLGRYDQAHPRLMRPANRMTSFMLAIGAHRRLRRPTLKMLSVVPPLFALLLSMHTRDVRVGAPGVACGPAGVH